MNESRAQLAHTSRDECNHSGDVPHEHTEPLWSRQTADEIEMMLIEDLVNGDLADAEATELITRVRSRTQPVAKHDARPKACEPQDA